mmetsp:Transcript_41150/g.82767  ORF Transcript_41150/g.82767 Transcript_41150/m.82767 type:complete len:99 (-) Transcript_41150:100-396(-)
MCRAALRACVAGWACSRLPSQRGQHVSTADLQRKMAELASKKGDDAAAKKAAFLREAEEAVRRASQQDANRRKPVQAMALSSEDSTPPITPPISPIKR